VQSAELNAASQALASPRWRGSESPERSGTAKVHGQYKNSRAAQPSESDDSGVEDCSADFVIPQPPLRMLPNQAQIEFHGIFDEKLGEVEHRLGRQLSQLQESLMDAAESIATLKRML
jgi:hypothetical protein